MTNVKVLCGDGNVLLAYRRKKNQKWTVKVPGGDCDRPRGMKPEHVLHALKKLADERYGGVRDSEIFDESKDLDAA